MINPNKIKREDFIGITATSSGSVEPRDIHKLENAYNNFKMLGYQHFIETPNVRTDDKFVSSDGETRAKEFMDLWKNKNVKWIISASGGEFLMEMLPYIDRDVIKNNTPKWVQGYSDTSLLLYYLTTNYNIATVHAYNFKTYGMRELDARLLKTIEILESQNISIQENCELYEENKQDGGDGMELEPFHLTGKVKYKHLYNKKEDILSGRLIGGCIDVLRYLLGTKLDHTVNFCSQFQEGMLWYLENCELSVPDLYRALWQMKQAGWFQNTNGFLIGRTSSKEKVGDFEYLDALHKAFDDLQVPVIYDVDIGHVAPQWTMINGAVGEFTYCGGKGKIVQNRIE